MIIILQCIHMQYNKHSACDYFCRDCTLIEADPRAKDDLMALALWNYSSEKCSLIKKALKTKESAKDK